MPSRRHREYPLPDSSVRPCRRRYSSKMLVLTIILVIGGVLVLTWLLTVAKGAV